MFRIVGYHLPITCSRQRHLLEKLVRLTCRRKANGTNHRSTDVNNNSSSSSSEKGSTKKLKNDKRRWEKMPLYLKNSSCAWLCQTEPFPVQCLISICFLCQNFWLKMLLFPLGTAPPPLGPTVFQRRLYSRSLTKQEEYKQSKFREEEKDRGKYLQCILEGTCLFYIYIFLTKVFCELFLRSPDM